MIKRTLIVIAAWCLAILLVAAMVTSLGYSFQEALLIGVLFLPGALASRFFLSKISFKKRQEGILNAVFVMVAILVLEIALVIFALIYIVWLRDPSQRLNLVFLTEETDFPSLLFNPVFLSFVLLLLVLGDYFLSEYLEKRFPSNQEPIRFISDRKPVKLQRDEILFIESNDREVTICATEGRRFRNKTGISQWEAILGNGFIRIHRSYLVRRTAISSVSAESLTAGGITLPVSRKYRDAVRQVHPPLIGPGRSEADGRVPQQKD